MKWEDFILEHDSADLGALALSRERFAGAGIDWDLALITLESRRKLRDKVPEWYACPYLRFPSRLSAEQCSSSVTARYKASVAHESGNSIADLTGGLGVDSWAFAEVFDNVLYNEMQPALADAARHNFACLGAGNIEVKSTELEPGNIDGILGDFRPDVIYLDPARRSSDGRKVFRLEDCTPNILELKDELLAACPRLLLKLSPMADISLVCRQLGNVSRLHVVATGGECKELLLVVERDYPGPYGITIFENGAVMDVPSHLRWTPPSYTAEGGHGFPDVPPRGGYLFEPGKALMKAGAFHFPCLYGLEKIEEHTHIYIGDSVPEELRPFGKTLKILEWVPLNKRTLKDIGKRYPEAGVTAKNIPFTSEQLKNRIGVKEGSDVRIFGLKALEGNIMIVCTPHLS